MNTRSLMMMITLMILSACTLLPPVETPAQIIHQNFKRGDTIIIDTLNDTHYEFQIIDMTQDSLVGKRQEFPFHEIRKVEKPVTSPILDTNIIPWGTGIVSFLLIISML